MNDELDQWDLENIFTALYKYATQSLDPSTQNAAVIVRPENFNLAAIGVNNFPPGVNDAPTERWERPLKYSYIEHAERGAIYEAAKMGLSTDGALMVAVWAACADCARAIVCSGVKTLVRHADVHDLGAERWAESIALADGILREGGVTVYDWRGTLPNAPGIRHDGKVFIPC